MPRHLLEGGVFDQLTDYCHSKKHKITEITVANSLAAWLPFDQLFCKFENIGGRDAPYAPQPAHSWLKAEKFAKNTFTRIDEAD